MKEVSKVKTIRERVYHTLKERILNDIYEPGEALSEQKLCKELDASRSPIREALRRLEAEELVVGESNKGVRVKVFMPEEIMDLYQTEMFFQLGSLHKNSHKTKKELTPKQRKEFEKLLVEFKRTYEEKNYIEYLKVSDCFHTDVVRFCGNEIIASAYRRIGVLNYRFRLLSLKDPIRFQASYEEHCSMIEDILKGDCKSAAKTMEKHLKEASTVVLKTMAKANHQKEEPK